MISFAFDFTAGDFVLTDGKAQKITGQELIKNKIEKLLRTEYGKYPIYVEYGMPFHNWMQGIKDREFVRLSLTRELTERIPKLVDGVRQIYDVDFNFTRNGVTVTFTVTTDYSEPEVVEIWLNQTQS